jgi:hypothetical protein
MFRCNVCGSIGLNPGACGICGAVTVEIREGPSGPSIVARQRLRPFRTTTKIAASIIVVLVAISTVGAGLYLSARPPAPLCSNHAVNYPSCNSCSSQEAYSSSTNVCSCTNGATNPDKCNRWCANNAINPPTGGGSRGCDQCADGRIVDLTGLCPPAERIVELPQE